MGVFHIIFLASTSFEQQQHEDQENPRLKFLYTLVYVSVKESKGSLPLKGRGRREGGLMDGEVVDYTIGEDVVIRETVIAKIEE